MRSFHRFKITSIPLCTFFQMKILLIYSKYDCFVTENNRKCSKVSVLFRATRYAFNTQEGNYYVLEKVYSPSDNCFMLAYNMLKNNFHCRSEKFCQIILLRSTCCQLFFKTTNQKKILLLDFDLQEIHIPLWIFYNLVASVSTFPFIVS